MKLVLLTLLFPMLCFGKIENVPRAAASVNQDSIPEMGFFLQNKKVFYQKVFSSDLKKEELNQQILTLLNTQKVFKFNRKKQFNKNELFLSMFQYKIDPYKYLGVTTFHQALYTPLNASLVIQVKDYKYRVTISEIDFTTHVNPLKDSTASHSFLEEKITDSKRNEIKQSKANEKLMIMLDEGFSDLFDLKNLVISSDF